MEVEVETDQSVLVVPQRDPKQHRRERKQPRYNVVLLDDDFHTYEYVIRMLVALFGYGVEKAYLAACEVDESGRVILLTTTREHAELKQEQVHAFGPDPLLARSEGSMSAILEPVQ